MGNQTFESQRSQRLGRYQAVSCLAFPANSPCFLVFRTDRAFIFFSLLRSGEPGMLSYVEVDTAHFLGNFPESCELHATNFDGQLPPDSAEWTSILGRSKLSAGKQHFFRLEQEKKSFSHVKLTMHPVSFKTFHQNLEWDQF